MEGEVSKKILKDSVSVFSAQLFILVISLISGIILARSLGPEGKGIYSTLLVYPSIMVSLLSLGMQQATVYYTGTKKHPDSDIIGVLLLILIISAIIGTFIALGVFLYTNNPAYNLTLILLASLIIPIELVINYMTGILIGKQQISKFNQIKSLIPVISCILILFFIIIQKWYIEGAILATLIAEFLLAVYALLYINKKYKLSICYRPNLIKKMVSLGSIYAVTLFVLNLNYKVDIIILEHLSNATEIGQYTVGVSFAELLWQLPAALGVVIFSYSANAKDPSKFSQDIAKMIRIVFPIILVGSLFLSYISGYIIPLLYGEEYIPSIKMLKILLPGIIMMSFFKIIKMDLAGKGKPDITLKIFVPAVLINIVLNLVLIPDFGGCGAAFASTVSYTMASLAILYYYVRTTKLTLNEIFICKRSDIEFISRIILQMKREKNVSSQNSRAN